MDFQGKTLFMVASGVMTAVGANTRMCAAAVEAGISGQRESGYVNKRNKPIRMATIPDGALPPLKEGLASEVGRLGENHGYLLRLASQALQECVAPLMPSEAVPLFLACPEALPGVAAPRLSPGFLKHLQIESEVNLDLSSSRVTYTGRAGGLEMVELAFKYLEATGRDLALVGGVDSYRYCLQHLSQLDSQDRLLVEGGLDGFIPGDGAGFVLLATAAALEKYALAPQLKLGYPCCAEEPGHRWSSQPYRGDGLAKAFRGALANGPQAPISAIYTSMNGEAFASKELGVAMTRSHERISDSVAIKHPADCFGDLGAAIGPVLLGLMSQTGEGAGLVYGSADGPYRSATMAWK